ncbi:hypothetical protein GIB67_024521, partial [Kingdonia uniflora]
GLFRRLWRCFGFSGVVFASRSFLLLFLNSLVYKGNLGYFLGYVRFEESSEKSLEFERFSL